MPKFVPNRFYQETIEFSPLDKLVVTWIAIWWVESAAIWIFTVNKKVRLIRIKNTISKLRDSKIADMVEALEGTKMKSIEKEIDAIFLKEWKITRARQEEIITEIFANNGFSLPKTVEPNVFRLYI